LKRRNYYDETTGRGTCFETAAFYLDCRQFRLNGAGRKNSIAQHGDSGSDSAYEKSREDNPNAQVLVRAVKFSNGAQWHIAQPTPVAILRGTI
jgi:hypothetical protein